jgi:hypothetical protein
MQQRNIFVAILNFIQWSVSWQCRHVSHPLTTQDSMLLSVSSQTSWQRWSGHFRALFPVPRQEFVDFPFARSDIARLADLLPEQPAALDRQTCEDMLLDQYEDRLAPGTSILGRQLLHRRLRGGSGPEELEASKARVRTLTEDASLLQQVELARQHLRRADTDTSEALFGPEIDAPPAWQRYLWLAPLALMVALLYAVGFAGGVMAVPAWLAVVAAWCALMALQTRFQDEAATWARTAEALRLMLQAHGSVAALDVPLAAPFQRERKLAVKLRCALAAPVTGRMPIAGEYGDWLLLKNIKHYFKTRQLVREHLGFMRDSFWLVATLDADLALARHLLATPAFCWAQRGEGAVALDDVVHPLLDGAAPLSLSLQGAAAVGGGAFISGRNGIGKSTLLRTVGLNVITARAFGFCYARSACVAPMPVYSSMKSEDALAGGESLYIAELRRAKELLALAAGGRPALFVIDEIFRGTNHLESVSAAAAVLHTLATSSLVLVSSHNLVLAPLLADCLVPLCVSPVVDGGVDGAACGRGSEEGSERGSKRGPRLRVAPGVLSDPNGIALLATRGFGTEIEAKAARVHDWLSAYLIHPADCAEVLGAPVAQRPVTRGSH